MKKLQTLALLALCIFLHSCGFFSDDPPPGSDIYDNPAIGADCIIDPDDFNDFFRVNLEEQIRCIEKNFESFILYVKREHQDHITEREIGSIIQRFFHENSEVIINALRLVFELNMILLHDENDRISTDNVSSLFELLISSNREAVNITKILSEIEKSNFDDKRIQFEASLKRMQQTTLSIINDRNGPPKELNLLTFLHDVRNRLQGIEITDEIIESLLIAKRVFVGGHPEILTSAEIRELINKFPKMVLIGLDLFFVNSSYFPEGERWRHFDFLDQRIAAIDSLFVNQYLDEKLISSEKVIEIAKDVAPDDIDINHYLNLFTSFKENLVGGDLDWYSLADIRLSMSYLRVLLQTLSLHNEYEILTTDLPAKHPANELNFIRSNLQISANLRTNKVKNIIEKSQIPNRLYLINFLKDLFAYSRGTVSGQFDFKIDNEFIDAISGVKVALLGGEKDVLTKSELNILIDQLPNYLIEIFNISRYSIDSFQNTRHYFRHLFRFLERVKNQYLYFFGDRSPEIFSIDDLLLIADRLLDDPPYEISLFRDTVIELKERLLPLSPGEVFTPRDIIYFTEMAEELLKKVYFIDTYYEAAGLLMDRPGPITHVPNFFHTDLDHLTNAENRQFKQVFDNIATSFRYFRNDDGIIHYGTNIKRYKKGFIETALIKWATQLLFELFDEDGSGGIGLDEAYEILNLFEPLLRELQMWGPEMDIFVRNTVLLSDLFQSNSNGSLEIDVDEFTEFAGLSLMSMQTADTILEELKKIYYESKDPLCLYDRSDIDDRALFPVPCVRKHYYDIIFYRLGLKDKLPQLYTYYKSVNHSETQEYLKFVEGFARDIPDDNEPMSYRDLSKIFGSMLNIEATFIRFDQNQNNILERPELDQAFQVYEDAIIAVADLDGSSLKYTHSIFLYMVRYRSIPSRTQLLNFHYNPFVDRNVRATRINIGAILYFLAMEDSHD